MSPTLEPGLRIVFLLESLELGGAERQAVVLAKALRESHGCDVAVAALIQGNLSDDATKPVVRLCQDSGIPWIVLGDRLPKDVRRYGRWLDAMKGALSALRPDVLMPYCILPNVACGLMWDRTGARTCIWNQRDEGMRRLAPRLERLAARATPWFISNSPRGAEYVMSRFGVASSRCRVIRNGVALAPPALRRNEWREQLKIGTDTFAACMLANLHRAKAHGILVRAWRIAADRLSAAGMDQPVLVLAGYAGDTAQELRALSRELRLERQMRFVGRTDDVAGLFGAMDLCVHSSDSEGLPNAILEAMSAGLAVVATDIAGARQALGPQGVRWLVPPRDANGMADRILALACSESTRAAVGAENRRRLLAEFSVRRLADETAVAIGAALGDASPRRSRRGLVQRVRGIALAAWLIGLSGREAVWQGIRGFMARTPLLWRLLRD